MEAASLRTLSTTGRRKCTLSKLRTRVHIGFHLFQAKGLGSRILFHTFNSVVATDLRAFIQVFVDAFMNSVLKLIAMNSHVGLQSA
jgi:hypothetical protein